MISKELESTLGAALEETRRRRHEYLCAEHVLYALLNDAYGKSILQNCGADIAAIRVDLDRFLSEELDRVPEGQDLVVQQTVGFDRLMQRALAHVQFSGKKDVDGGDVIAAMFEEEGSYAAYVLQHHGVTRLDVLNFISHGDETAMPESEGDEAFDDLSDDDDLGGRKSDPLAAYTVNLSARAAAGKIDPLIGRELELRRAMRVLCRRQKNNPVFVGEPGVGKTAMVEGLALRIHEGNVPPVLQDVEIVRLDLASLLAGTKFRGEFEARLKAVVAALLKREHTILFIDEIHTVVGAGTTSESTVDAAALLKPILTSGELRCIGATTYDEYKKVFTRDRALARRFQKIDIEEPSVEDTVRILRGLKSRYEEHHGIHFTDSALKAAAELSERFIADRFLPDKAIDVIDEAAAELKLLPRADRKTIRALDVEKMVAEMARVPVRSVSADDSERLERLEDDLNQVVFGQQEAVHAIATSIKRSRAGLGNPERPVGSFLFTGPTGVGKTELARQLAATLGIHFVRYDMSEYQDKFSVTRLIGSPPGYVGYEEGGQLTDEIRRHPHSVVLMDEIEKADPEIFNILLQVMDYGMLTDNMGRKADFRNAILVITSNAGARELDSNAIGFAARTDESRHKSLRAVEKTFSPEFRNRIDAIVTFDGLPKEIVLRIVDKFLGELADRMKPRKVTLDASNPARQWLADKGFDAKLGARPLARLIQREIEDRIADELLFGKLAKGGTVRIDCQDDALIFSFTSNAS
jgi:ATP-dependent Clp protease ATP-binding subunit ClpA